MIQNFSVSQTVGLPNIISIADTSTNTFDPAITVREVVMVDANGNYITANGSSVTPTSTTWLVADASIAIDCLPVDMALQITVNWLSVTGVVLYTKTALYDFTQYGVLTSFALTQDLTGNPRMLQDTNYWMNRMILRCNIDDADNAVSIGGNIYIAQSALDREQEMISRQNLYF